MTQVVAFISFTHSFLVVFIKNSFWQLNYCFFKSSIQIRVAHIDLAFALFLFLLFSCRSLIIPAEGTEGAQTLRSAG